MPAFAKRRAAEDPTGFALVDAHREYTWSEVDEALNRCANLLLDAGARGELGEEHRIAVFAENAAETALAHLGGLLAGASTVPVNFHLTASEAAYILEGFRESDRVRRPRDGRTGARRSSRSGGRHGDRLGVRGCRGRHRLERVARRRIDRRSSRLGHPASEPALHVGYHRAPQGHRARHPPCSPVASTWPNTSNASPRAGSPCSVPTSSSGRCTTPVRSRGCGCCVPACRR